MIKCIGFLKSLKQLLFILLISCFIFGVGSSASAVFPASVSVSPGDYYNSSDIDIDSFRVSENLTFSKVITYKHYFDEYNIQLDYAFYWDTDGYLHFYVDTNIGKSDYKVLQYNLVNSGDNTVINQNQFIDYVSNNINNIYSVSFRFGYTCQSSPDVGTTFKITFNDGIYIYFSAGLCEGNNLYVSPGGGPLSSPFSGTIDSLSSYSSPFIYGGQGSASTEITIGLTGDYSYTSCTQGEILGMLENQGFSRYMCYGGLDNFDLWSSTGSYSPIPGTGKRLSQILSYSSVWDTPQEWFEYWNGLYLDKDNPLYYTMWESYPAVYRTWFEMYYKYGNNKYFDSIREYCVMKVDLTLNSGLVYKGTQFKGVCDTIIDIKQNPQDYTTDSGGRIVGVNWVGVGQLSGNNKTATQFIQDFFNTIKAQINTNYDGPGFIPAYIILFMLALIFFRFLSH